MILGDQGVVITKVFFFVFEEVDLRVRGVSSSCGSSVEVRPRQASVLAVCLFLREQVKGLVSPRSSSVNSL